MATYLVNRVTRVVIAGPYRAMDALAATQAAEPNSPVREAKVLTDETGTAQVGAPFPRQSWEA